MDPGQACSTRVVLCVPPVSAMVEQRAYSGTMPNIGICYLASALETAGCPVEVLNHGAVSIEPQTLAERILAFEPGLVGFTLYDFNLEGTLRVLQALRERYHGPIVLGGYAATFAAERILRLWSRIDYVILGEGEGPLVALVEHLEGRREIEAVPSLAHRRGQEVALTPRAPLPELDALAWPARRWPAVELATPLLTGRGCGSQCGICAMVPFYDRSLGPAVRRRDPVDVVAEMCHCHERGSGLFFVYDDSFPLASRSDRAWCRRFLAELERRDLRVPFMVQTRVIDVLRGRDLLSALCDAGLCHVSLGLESLLPRQLTLYGKLHDRTQGLEALQVLRALPILMHANVLFWDPFVTMDEVREHADALGRHGLVAQEGAVGTPSHRSVLTLFAETGLQRRLVREGLAQPDLFSLQQFGWDFCDPETRAFYHQVYRVFLERTAVPRPPAVWLCTLTHELQGRGEQAAHIRGLARRMAQLEFDYFLALLELWVHQPASGDIAERIEAVDAEHGEAFRAVAAALCAADGIE